MTPQQQAALDNVIDAAKNVGTAALNLAKETFELAKESPTAVLLGVLGFIFAPVLFVVGAVAVGAGYQYVTKKLGK